jgi:hypothetical protein
MEARLSAIQMIQKNTAAFSTGNGAQIRDQVIGNLEHNDDILKVAVRMAGGDPTKGTKQDHIKLIAQSMGGNYTPGAASIPTSPVATAVSTTAAKAASAPQRIQTSGASAPASGIATPGQPEFSPNPAQPARPDVTATIRADQPAGESAQVEVSESGEVIAVPPATLSAPAAPAAPPRALPTDTAAPVRPARPTPGTVVQPTGQTQAVDDNSPAAQPESAETPAASADRKETPPASASELVMFTPKDSKTPLWVPESFAMAKEEAGQGTIGRDTNGSIMRSGKAKRPK